LHAFRSSTEKLEACEPTTPAAAAAPDIYTKFPPDIVSLAFAVNVLGFSPSHNTTAPNGFVPCAIQIIS